MSFALSYSPVCASFNEALDLRSLEEVARGRKPRKPVTAEDVGAIQKLYHDDRLSIRAVVEATGFSLWQVRQAVGASSRTLSEAGRTEVEPEVQIKILKLRKRDLTYSEIAQKVERAKSFVAKIVQEGLNGSAHTEVIKRITQRPFYDYDQIIELSDQGKTMMEITQLLGCGRSTVAKARREAGWTYWSATIRVRKK